MGIQILPIQKHFESKFEVAKKYYSVLLLLNGIHVTPTELNMLSYIAVNGTISTPPVRDEFMKEFKVHKNHVYNMQAQLQKLNLLIKDKDNKVRVHPNIHPDFDNPELILMVKLHRDVE